MLRDYVVKTASVLLFIGFASGIAGQVELMKPGISFMSPSLYSQSLALHAWATSISLLIICLSTISLILDRTTLGQWGIWLGFCAVPLLFGALINLTLANIASPKSVLQDTFYLTANRHAYGTAGLLIALGGLSALQSVRFKRISRKISFAFALLIASSGLALSFYQTQLGLFGMPRGYVDYPIEFTQLQFYSSVAAIACFSLSVFYIIILWRHSDNKAGKIEEVF